MGRPRVNMRAVADQYAGPRERIVEFSSAGGGGLIAFREQDTEAGTRLAVDLYRLDDSVEVRQPGFVAVEHVRPGQRVRWPNEVEGEPWGEAVVWTAQRIHGQAADGRPTPWVVKVNGSDVLGHFVDSDEAL